MANEVDDVEPPAEEFMAGGGGGNVRAAAERLAALAAKGNEMMTELVDLELKIRDNQLEIDRAAKKEINERKILRVGCSYITNKGVLSVYQGDSMGVSIMLVPLAPDCDHAKPTEVPF